MRNHTAAHLLQAALRKVLGDHVHQAGSYVDEERCRFDFSHFEAVTHEQLAEIENIVNKNIFDALSVTMTEMPIEEARKLGAMALFGEKYGDIVRVVKAGDVSVEFCGGTHIDNTSRLGLFRIVSENSVAAGVRRIEAVTGEGVLKLIGKYYGLLTDAAAALKTAKAEDVPAKCAAAAAEIKTLEKEKAELNSRIARSQTGNLMANAVKVGAVSVATAELSGVPADILRKMGDDAKDKNPSGVAVIVSKNGESASILCVCGKEAVAAGANAGRIVKEIAAVTGGKGGGRPDSAMAGAGDVSLIGKALESAAEIVRAMLK